MRQAADALRASSEDGSAVNGESNYDSLKVVSACYGCVNEVRVNGGSNYDSLKVVSAGYGCVSMKCG